MKRWVLKSVQDFDGWRWLGRLRGTSKNVERKTKEKTRSSFPQCVSRHGWKRSLQRNKRNDWLDEGSPVSAGGLQRHYEITTGSGNDERKRMRPHRKAWGQAQHPGGQCKGLSGCKGCG